MLEIFKYLNYLNTSKMSLFDLFLPGLKKWCNVVCNNLTVWGDLILFGNVEFEGNVLIDGNLEVLGATNLNTLGCTGATTLDSTLDVYGASRLHSTLDVSGASSLASLGVTGTSTFNGASTFKTTITQTGGSTTLLDTTTNVLKSNGYFFAGSSLGFNVGTIRQPSGTGTTNLTASQLVGGVIITDATIDGNFNMQLPDASDVQALIPASFQAVGYSLPIFIEFSNNQGFTMTFLDGVNFLVAGTDTIASDTTFVRGVIIARIDMVSPTFTMGLYM